ncbi:MAG: dUTP diphosphatase [Patescibacteria group bacterium]|nr:dUTP diphosphatase [Patescibacteria group bacterium]MDW8279602.1 dUTP diphosphatase [bacterium]
MKIYIQKIDADAKLPSLAYQGDAGIDLYSAEEVIIQSMENKAVRTGIKIAIPEGYAGFIWDKSGLALNSKIKTMAGVIDSGYRGEVRVVMFNLGKTDYKVEKGVKIAQLVIMPIINYELEEVNELDETHRGEKGFGSSGLN